MAEDLMADTTMINDMKRHAVIVSITAKHSTSFIWKFRKELNENYGD